MTNDSTLRSDTGNIAAAEVYFNQLIGRLRKVVSDVQQGRSVAGRALKAQGMSRFQQAFEEWQQQINDLEGELKKVSHKTQQAGHRMNYADRMTDEIGGRFAGINR